MLIISFKASKLRLVYILDLRNFDAYLSEMSKMMFTARYMNSAIDKETMVPVSISRYLPKLKTSYDIKIQLLHLAPGKEYVEEQDEKLFLKLYRKQLDIIGVRSVFKVLWDLYEPGKEIVLLCSEDIRDNKSWCHRRMFAEWFSEKTGIVIEELEEPAQIKIRQEVSQMTLF